MVWSGRVGFCLVLSCLVLSCLILSCPSCLANLPDFSFFLVDLLVLVYMLCCNLFPTTCLSAYLPPLVCCYGCVLVRNEQSKRSSCFCTFFLSDYFATCLSFDIIQYRYFFGLGFRFFPPPSRCFFCASFL
jgi:hypothetical protein